MNFFIQICWISPAFAAGPVCESYIFSSVGILHAGRFIPRIFIGNYEMSLCVRKPTILVPTRSETNEAVQSQKMVRGWKFWTQKVEDLCYQCSENTHLCSYCEADLRLCFRLCRLLVFPCGILESIILFNLLIFVIQNSFW